MGLRVEVPLSHLVWLGWVIQTGASYRIEALRSMKSLLEQCHENEDIVGQSGSQGVGAYSSMCIAISKDLSWGPCSSSQSSSLV